jgi:hypothetical protein
VADKPYEVNPISSSVTVRDVPGAAVTSSPICAADVVVIPWLPVVVLSKMMSAQAVACNEARQRTAATIDRIRNDIEATPLLGKPPRSIGPVAALIRAHPESTSRFSEAYCTSELLVSQDLLAGTTGSLISFAPAWYRARACGLGSEIMTKKLAPEETRGQAAHDTDEE